MIDIEYEPLFSLEDLDKENNLKEKLIQQSKVIENTNSLYDIQNIILPTTKIIKSVVSPFDITSHGEEAKHRALQGLKGFTKGLRTFDSLDKVTFGLRKEQQIVIFGEPKSGKSTILQNFLFNALADNLSKPPSQRYKIFVNWFSLEMTGASLFQRFMSNYLKATYNIDMSYSDLEGFTDKNLTESQINEYYDKAIEYVSQLGTINIIDIPRNVTEISSYLRDFHLSVGGGKLVNGKFVAPDDYMYINVVDHMKLIRPGKEADEFKRAEALSQELYMARNMYRDCNILLNQTNTGVTDEENKNNDYTPQRDHLYGGKGIIMDADLVLSIGSPYLHKLPEFPSRGKKDERYNIASLKNRYRSLNIVASRFCDVGVRINLESDFATSTIRELPAPNKINYSNYL